MNGNTKWILSLIALFIFIATAMGGYAIGEVDEVKMENLYKCISRAC